MDRSDEEVFIASLKNPDLFAVIFDRYQEPFLRKARNILHDEEEAHDAVQEAFVRIYSAARQYRKLEGASFKSWAYKILINQCLTLYRKNKKRLDRATNVEALALSTFEDVTATENQERKINKDYVLSLISKLPILLARVVDLHFLKELPQKEIAQIEGVSHEVIRARIHRAKKELRKIEQHLAI